ncbi:hypothetical protein [Variovorax gracilis]|uniref:hypothetical protein n=1 Tax=Variovorax gracilis TaxID=3053502 RepID=UPI0025771F53|nr:hypothetical protein [Variovorax sp. J22R24]
MNAAKSEFKTRPHFRHPDGAEKSACTVLAARAAVLSHFREEGWLELPRRRMSAEARGLSGTQYQAWVERPSEKVHISNFDFRDRAFAVLTLDDGRTLRVQLTGTAGGSSADEHGVPQPTIFLDLQDVSLASMTPADLRRRLSLLPNSICWLGHWDDADLQAAAERAARAEAERYLDEVPADLELPEGLAPACRRETLLHYEVKRILEQARELMVPGLKVEVEVPLHSGGSLNGSWSLDAERILLSNVRLEHRFGPLVPDVFCDGTTVAGVQLRPLLVEVTVTNVIDADRIGRIRTAGAAALEINLGLTGGRVTRDELRQLVVEELAAKRWLHYPELERQRAVLQTRLELQAAEEIAAKIAADKEAARLAQERRLEVLATPATEIGRRFLAAVTARLDEETWGRRQLEAPSGRPLMSRAQELVAEAVGDLSMHGYPEAGDVGLVGFHGLLSRLLTIQLDRGVGFRFESALEALNAFRQSHIAERTNFILFFIAVRAYRPDIRAQEWFTDWTNEVKASVQSGERTYARNATYDRILTLLFPEMAGGLSKDFGKLKPSTGYEVQPRYKASHRENVAESEASPKVASPTPQLGVQGSGLDADKRGWWLRGRDLDAWCKANPESAAAFFGQQSRRKS